MSKDTPDLERDELDMRDREAVAAISAIQSYLHDYWISDGCHDYTLMGCPSCQAIAINDQLTMLANSISENIGEPVASLQPKGEEGNGRA